MTVTMPSIKCMLIMTSVWMTGSKAQKECAVDADCAVSQYCYEISSMCVDYILCSRYNRQESSQRSRNPSQCGKCREGFSASELTLESSGEAESCTKDPRTVEVNDQSTTTVTWVIVVIIIGFLFLGGLLYAIYVKFPNKFPLKTKPTSIPEKPDLPMAENGESASLPLTSDSSENLKNKKYEDAEETNPLSTIKENRCSFKEESNQPSKAHNFMSPGWVREDRSYDPGDDQIVQTTFSPTDNAEEINPTNLAPRSLTGTVITTTLPHAAIAQAEFDNTTNIALEIVALASPLSSEEGRDAGGNNNSSENRGESESNNTDGNRPGNSSSIFITQNVNLLYNFNQGRNGR